LRGVLHAVVALAAIPATVWLAAHARPGVSTTISITYGAALILVFGTSGLYHTPHWSLPTRRRAPPRPLDDLHHEVNHLLGVTGAIAHYVAICRLLT
jgi:predicted membrane channel-forming protein YqfA (hemolysin III family)